MTTTIETKITIAPTHNHSTHLPFVFGKVLLQLLANRMINVLVAGQIPGNPGMLECELAGVALSGVHADQVRYEILGRLGDVVPIGAVEFVFALHNLRKQIIVVTVLVVEGRITAQQNVGYHADRPNVHCLSVAALGLFVFFMGKAAFRYTVIVFFVRSFGGGATKKRQELY